MVEPTGAPWADRFRSVAGSVEARHAGAPEVLYHYTTAEGLRGILETNSLWATHIAFLNDAKEFHLALGLTRELLKRFEEDAVSDVARKVIGAVGSVLDTKTPQYYVTSFSELRDDLSQWRAYGARTGGYAIGFRTAELEPNFRLQLTRLIRVLYTREEQSKLVSAALSHVEPFFEEIGPQLEQLKDPGELASFLALHRLTATLIGIAPAFKDKSFQMEREWRLVADLEEIDSARGGVQPGPRPWRLEHLQTHFRTTRHVVVPYLVLQLDPEHRGLQLEEIVVGPTPHPELARMGVERLLDKTGVGCGEINTSETPFREW